MAHGFIKDIKGYHDNILSSSKSYIKNSYDGYTISPVIVASGLPN
jgi:hypothetical protein